MQRRDFLKQIGAGTLAISATSCSALSSALKPSGPNLLIIQTDEHHFNTLGCYGGTIVETPHIDSISADGAQCNSFYATTPVCSPSRGAFMTGQYPQNTPVVNNNIPLADEVVTFSEILRRTGYATGYSGKWHLDGDGKPQWAPERQFGFADNRFMFNRGHWKKMEDTADGPRIAARDNKGGPSYNVDEADEKSFATDWLCDKTIDFINEHKDSPFCYMVSLPDPHGPNTVRSPYDTMYADIEVPIPATLNKTAEQTPKWAAKDKKVTEASIRKIMPAYYGMVKCIDDNIGRILDTLRSRGILDNTIVVFTADHGDLCGEHGRLNKGVPYEGSAKIPFVARYPKKIPAGTVINQALTCVDFLPTALGLMGVPTVGREEGRDASALFTGNAPADWNDVAFFRSTTNNGWFGAITDQYKLIYAPNDVPWLFDLKADPDELTNCFTDPAYREVVKRLTGELVAYCKQYGDPRGEDENMKPQIEAALA